MGSETKRFTEHRTPEEGRRSVKILDLEIRLAVAARRLYNAQRPQTKARALAEVNWIKAQLKEERSK
jgi:hypothetical protein